MATLKIRPIVKQARSLMDRDPHKALAMLDAALEEHPTDLHALYVRGQVLAFRLGRPKDARANLHAAYSCVVKEGYFVPDVHRAFAKCLVMLGERKAAREVLDGCLSVYPDELNAWIERSDISKMEGKIDAAIADTREVLARAPKHPLGLYNLACYLALAGSTDEALDALEAAIAVTPEDKETARKDDDFRSLQKNARFEKLIGG